jgi:hypothetical protein
MTPFLLKAAVGGSQKVFEAGCVPIHERDADGYGGV